MLIPSAPPIALRADLIVFLTFLFTLLLNVTFIGEAYFFSSSSNSITSISLKKYLSAVVYCRTYILPDYTSRLLHKLLLSVSAYLYYNKHAVRWAMRDLLYIPFKFEDGGMCVIHYTPED